MTPSLPLVMSGDDTPTPKQSGTYGVMGDICQRTRSELADWLPHAPLSALDKLRELFEKTNKLEVEVEGWARAEPTQDEKRDTVNKILDLRAEAEMLARSYGHDLNRSR